MIKLWLRAKEIVAPADWAAQTEASTYHMLVIKNRHEFLFQFDRKMTGRLQVVCLLLFFPLHYWRLLVQKRHFISCVGTHVAFVCVVVAVGGRVCGRGAQSETTRRLEKSEQFKGSSVEITHGGWHGRQQVDITTSIKAHFPEEGTCSPEVSPRSEEMCWLFKYNTLK